MNWILNHASEIVLAVIIAAATKGLDYFLAKRSRVIAFFTHGAQHRFFTGQAWNPVNTMALALQNTGRATAEEIRIVHRRQPLNYQVYPSANPTDTSLPGGEWELRIPSILAKQTVFVSYLDGLTLDSTLITYMASKEHVIHPVRTRFARIWPKWLQWLQVGLLGIGTFVVLRYAYGWTIELIRFFARR